MIKHTILEQNKFTLKQLIINIINKHNQEIKDYMIYV